MPNTTEIMGFVGAGMAGAAYVPQISHLIRAHCSDGISRPAFELWLVASLLTTVRAVAIGAGVFIVLGTIQIVATALIMRYATRYQDTPCPSHLPARASSDGNGSTRTMPLSVGSIRPRRLGHGSGSALVPQPSAGYGQSGRRGSLGFAWHLARRRVALLRCWVPCVLRSVRLGLGLTWVAPRGRACQP